MHRTFSEKIFSALSSMPNFLKGQTWERILSWRFWSYLNEGLLLPLHLYFQPSTFLTEHEEPTIELSIRMKLWRKGANWGEEILRREVLKAFRPSIFSMLWALPLIGVLTALGYSIDTAQVLIGIIVGLTVGFVVARDIRLDNISEVGLLGLFLGLLIGLSITIPKGLSLSIESGLTFGIILGVATGLRQSEMISGASTLAILILSVIPVIILIRVGNAISFLLIPCMVAGIVSGVRYGGFGGLCIGISLGLVGGVTEGDSHNLISAALMGVTNGLLLSFIEKTVFKNEKFVGLLWCVMMVFFLMQFTPFQSGLVFGIAGVFVLYHLHLFPLQASITSLGWVLTRLNPDRFSAMIWRILPIRWDETILLPLPGIVSILVSLNQVEPKLGKAAISSLNSHPYQGSRARKVLVKIYKEEAKLVTSLSSLAVFGRGLDWVSSENKLKPSTQRLLSHLVDISSEVKSAMESNSATNKVRRLTAAIEMLRVIRLQSGDFALALANWPDVLSRGLEEAKRQQLTEEPIPQVYVSDGRPIKFPDGFTQGLPFKGRTALFRQLETALGGRRDERTTYVLYGQRRTGKTSVLVQLPRRLGSQIIPIFLDMQSEKLGGASSIIGFLNGLIEVVREEALRYRGIVLPEIDVRALAIDPFRALGHWLDQVESRLGEATLLLCLDEFEVLEDGLHAGRLDTRILHTIRNIVQHRNQIAILLSGSHQIGELPPHWASALITTTVMIVSFLAETDARELIEQPIPNFPMIYSPEAVDLIIWLTHCQPYLVQLLCALLVERMNIARRIPPESVVTVEDVKSVVPLSLERGQNYFIDLWRTQTGNDLARQVLTKIVSSSKEQISPAKLRRIERDESLLHEALATLLRREIIERINSSYRITVPLISEYVRCETLL
jgi:uncharacterized protein